MASETHKVPVCDVVFPQHFTDSHERGFLISVCLKIKTTNYLLRIFYI